MFRSIVLSAHALSKDVARFQVLDLVHSGAPRSSGRLQHSSAPQAQHWGWRCSWAGVCIGSFPSVLCLPAGSGARASDVGQVRTMNKARMDITATDLFWWGWGDDCETPLSLLG